MSSKCLEKQRRTERPRKENKAGPFVKELKIMWASWNVCGQ